jgi:hypothetical protein
MQIFGLISLLITLALIGWFFWSPSPYSTVPTEADIQEYNEAIDSAENVVDILQNR